ncbi:MAG: methyltransferase family protein [Bacteroidota bacterium]
MGKASRLTLVWAGLGAAAIFVFMYGIELFGHGGKPITIRWVEELLGKGGLIALNIVVMIAFLALLPYRRPAEKTWRSRGTFIAFVIALVTEMFGWPLLIFLISPLVEIPSLRDWARQNLGHVGPVLGTWLSMAGLTLVVVGWRAIHKAEGLVTSGIYRYMRHPQYVGIFLFTLGWLLHWPTVTMLILWPILIIAYVWLAIREERAVAETYGDEYGRYAERTPRFFPRLNFKTASS